MAIPNGLLRLQHNSASLQLQSSVASGALPHNCRDTTLSAIYVAFGVVAPWRWGSRTIRCWGVAGETAKSCSCPVCQAKLVQWRQQISNCL